MGNLFLLPLERWQFFSDHNSPQASSLVDNCNYNWWLHVSLSSNSLRCPQSATLFWGHEFTFTWKPLKSSEPDWSCRSNINMIKLTMLASVNKIWHWYCPYVIIQYYSQTTHGLVVLIMSIYRQCTCNFITSQSQSEFESRKTTATSDCSLSLYDSHYCLVTLHLETFPGHGYIMSWLNF